ncbi:hypothetical protein GCM10022215_24030 [Nocardioides fonticola]|uniref:Uncharacterized protein n=1 Tax=Nocardioides fonticola TaxID=450363 RepID=A0ABP7XJP2_9ACTN
MSTLSPRQMFLLDIACAPLREAFGETPYLVGTTMEPRGDRAPRDVDVRLILDDKRHAKLTKAIGSDGISFLGLAVGQYLASLTGLPIDFQIQQQTAANDHHGGKRRNPLGLRSLANFSGDAPIGKAKP